MRNEWKEVNQHDKSMRDGEVRLYRCWFTKLLSDGSSYVEIPALCKFDAITAYNQHFKGNKLKKCELVTDIKELELYKNTTRFALRNPEYLKRYWNSIENLQT